MIKYTVAMTIRVICIALCLVVPGWWALVPALGAVFLPYIAVVLANTANPTRRGRVQRPGALRQRSREKS